MSNKNIIYKQRLLLGLTQKQLAELVGVSRQTIFEWETLRYPKKSKHVEKLGEIFMDTDFANKLKAVNS